jgi:penicillin-binding protein 1A
MGFTPSLSAGCWVGGDERTIHFDSMANGQGASSALPIVGLFYQKVFADKSLGYSQTERFPVLSGYGVCDRSEEVGEDPDDNKNVGIDNMFK